MASLMSSSSRSSAWTIAANRVASIRDEDSCINFNFRADRARQITRVLARESGVSKEGGRDLPDWEGLDATIPRSRVPKIFLTSA